MRIDLLFPAFPPALDGIGDHTAHLAAALAERHRVRVLTAQAAPSAMEGVDVLEVEIPGLVAGDAVCTLDEALTADQPDWLLLQYNPFSYGRWGFNAHLPLALLRLRRATPDLRLAVMVHEPHVPFDSWRHAVMSVWQRPQLAALARTADLLLVSTETWTYELSARFRNTPVEHAPVGSNVPYVAPPPDGARRAFGIDADQFVVGLFGSAHPSRLLTFVRQAALALARDGHAPLVLYVGPHEAPVRAALGAVPLVATGPLPGDAVSRAFASMDLYLAPFRKGVSSRRGSFVAGLQHGVATVSTTGVHTGPSLLALNGHAVLLAPDHDPVRFARCAVDLARDDERRRHLGQVGRDHFERTLTWSHIAAGIEAAMSRCTPPVLSIPSLQAFHA